MELKRKQEEEERKKRKNEEKVTQVWTRSLLSVRVSALSHVSLQSIICHFRLYFFIGFGLSCLGPKNPNPSPPLGLLNAPSSSSETQQVLVCGEETIILLVILHILKALRHSFRF